MHKSFIINNLLDPDKIDVADTIIEEVSDYTESPSESSSFLSILGCSEVESHRSNVVSLSKNSSVVDDSDFDENQQSEVELKKWSDIKFHDKTIEMFETEYLPAEEGDGFSSSSSSE
jgi:hypothetical protein